MAATVALYAGLSARRLAPRSVPALLLPTAARAVRWASSSSLPTHASPPPPPSPPPAEPNQLPSGTIAKLKFVAREYGAAAVGLYSALWVGPAFVVYHVAAAHGNWGLDPMLLLDYVGMRDTVTGYLGLPPDGTLQPWQTSGVIAFGAADALEIVRVPATLYLAPRAKRWWVARRQPAAEGGGDT